MRIFHTSDTHLGHQQYPALGPDGLNARESDITTAWLQIVDAAVAQHPDIFIHAGDLFDGVRPGNRALAAAMEGLLRLSRAGIPTILIAGNHDHPRMRSTGSPLRLFGHLDNVRVVYQGHREVINVGPATVHAIPQCADQEALAIEVQGARGEMEATRKNNAQDENEPPPRQYNQRRRENAQPSGWSDLPADEEKVLRRERNGHGPHILVLHGAVRSIDAFGNAEFNQQILEPSWFAGFDYAALGHFHGVTEVAQNAWYCGASERVSIAEAGQDKGYLDVELAGRDVAPGPLDARVGPIHSTLAPLDVTFRGLAGRPYVDLPIIHAKGLDAAEIGAAAEGALGRVPPGAVARLRIDDVSASLRGVLDLKGLHSEALHLELRIHWRDAPGMAPIAIGGVLDSWRSFAAGQVIEGVDRDTVMTMAEELLGEAR